MIWIAVDASLYENNKIKGLRNALKLNSTEEAMGFMVKFWGWGIKNADRTGLLINCNEQDIADAFGWRGRNSALIAALTAIQRDGKSGLLEKTASGDYRIHDFEEIQKAWFKYLDTLEADRKRKREKTKETPPEIPPEKPEEKQKENQQETRQENQPEIQAERPEEITEEKAAEIPPHNQYLNRNPDTLDEDDDSVRARDPGILTPGGAPERKNQYDYDEESRPEIGEPSGREIDRLKKQWFESFGERCTPEQVNYLKREAWFTPEAIFTEAIREAAYRGASTNRVLYISRILGTWRSAKISTVDELSEWRAKQDLKAQGIRENPPPILSLVNGKRQKKTAGVGL